MCKLQIQQLMSDKLLQTPVWYKWSSHVLPVAPFFEMHSLWSEFVCLFVLRFYGPVNPMGSCRARSVYLTTRLLGRLKRLTSIVHILSPETDNCPSWISRREKMTVENISWSISTKECCRPRRGLNPRPPGIKEVGVGLIWVCFYTPTSLIPL